MISLSDLKAKRAAMTQGEWRASRHGSMGPHDFVVSYPAGDYDLFDEDEALGIVATHNAADVLIEIAEAALAYRDAPFEDCNACLLRLAEALDRVRP